MFKLKCLNPLLISLILILLSCNYTSKVKKSEFKIIHNYEGVNIPEYIKYYSKENGITSLDSISYFTKTGIRYQLCKYDPFTSDSIINFENNVKNWIYIPQKKITLLYDRSGYVNRILNDSDSSVIIFYKNSNKIRKLYKFNNNYTYYYNIYDSTTGNIIDCYRDLKDTIITKKDSCEITFNSFSSTDKIEFYKIIMVELNKVGIVQKTYFHKNKTPKFKFKEENKKFIKVICDSLGCYSLPYEIIMDKNN